MERREQRVRRDRKKDGRRNPVQKDEDREKTKSIVNHKPATSDSKESDTKNEVTTAKTPIKDRTLDDDPLRFANLKRETDEIVALKSKKPQKRQVFSNWWRYEEPLPSTDESQAVDFETLLHAPQSGNFKFKAEKHWDAGSYGQYGELFMPDAELLVAGLTSIPFYIRLGIDKTLLLDDEVTKMDSCAQANSVAYEKVNKLKQKPKHNVKDLLKINYADEFSAMDKENVPPGETGPEPHTRKPQFAVEQSPELVPSAGSVRPAVPSRGGTPTTVCVEVAAQDLHFVKPTPPPSSASSNHTPLLSRETTPAKEAASAPDLGGLPPHSCISSSRESTPLKGTTPRSSPVKLPQPEISVGDSVRELEVARSLPTTPETIALEKNGALPEETATVPPDESLTKEEIRGLDNTNTEKQTANSINPKDGDMISEKRQDEYHSVGPKSYQKKGSKADNKKDTSQKVGGKHNRRKKAQQSSIREQQTQVDMADEHLESAALEDSSDLIEEQGTTNTELLTEREEPEVQKEPEPPQHTTPGHSSPGATSAAPGKRAPQEPVKKIPSIIEKTEVRADDDHLNFLMSLRDQKAVGISEVEAAKSLRNIAVSRSAIEEDELRESQKPITVPLVATEKKEDLEDWLDSMLDD